MDAKSIIAGYSVTNEKGEVTSIDLNGLDKLIAELRSEAKDIRAKNKDAIKAQAEADKADAAKVGREYYNKLAVGDAFDIIIAGQPVHVTKIAVKAKVANSAACAIVEWKDDGSMGKTPNRYLGFDKVIVA